MIVKGETIAAISTPPGEGGIAVVRLSGARAVAIASKIFSGKVEEFESHTAHLGYVIDEQGKKIDQVLLIVFKEGRSYTGEETVEIYCHGGVLVSKKVLECLLSQGAKLASPGAFTFSAFMNGKIDLVQAEAVQKLIAAKSERAYLQATLQMEGALSKKLHFFKERLLHLSAIFEAWVDFPEEGLEFATKEEVEREMVELEERMVKLSSTFEEGKKIHHSFSIALVGAPNVGKSSLLNALLGKERAIVTEIAGTTRDRLEEEYLLGGRLLKLIDTAGLRETEDRIEKEGIRRTREVFKEADLILFILDASKGIQEEEERLLLPFLPSEKTLLVWNKIDLKAPPPSHLPWVAISAKEGIGIDALKERIEERLSTTSSKEEVLITTLRHKESLDKAIGALHSARLQLTGEAFSEIIAFEMRTALTEIASLLGSEVTEELLSSIFSKFCVGK